MKGYLHKISTVRSGKDDKMDNVTNRHENYLIQLVVFMLDQGKKCWRIKDSNICRRKREDEEIWKTYGHYKKYGPKGTISIGERKEDSRKITQTYE